MHHDTVRDVLSALGGHSVGNFIRTLCMSPTYSDCPTYTLFAVEIPDHPATKSEAGRFILQHFTTTLSSEVTTLANKESGWHFSAGHASSGQIEAFSMEGMARKFEDQAPHLWALLGHLLASDPSRKKRTAQAMNEVSGIRRMSIGMEKHKIVSTWVNVGWYSVNLIEI